MTLLVPFDGAALSTTALRRATEFATFRDEQLVVLTVVPDDPEYARERDWLDPGDTFDVGVIERKLRQRVLDLAPEADFRCELIENVEPVASETTDVARRIREVAAELDVSVVFVGSENAGRVTNPLSSVGSPVADTPQYDVYIARRRDE
ncbi:universal stress protein [Haloarchaeobius litoreus]|uniref:Universal stress protein n=1 Tax=Haloarchaeobius litoreus TaxID=755306 RepID=A0ABD6DP23_9EURY|nr:universal stress protein [Haloarchaeobius litoreus]